MPMKSIVLIRPERIEVKEPVPVARLIAEIFRPVGGVADLDLRPEELRTSAARSINCATAGKLLPAPRICVRARISDPMQKDSTPPTAAQSAA